MRTPPLPLGNPAGMKTYTFTIAVTDQTADGFEDLAEALYEAGCDDATVSLCEGTVSIDFDREAETMDEALRSAVKQVESVGCVVARVEIEDLATIREVA